MKDRDKMSDMFDSIAEKYVNKEECTGAVIMGVFSEDEEVGFHAACGSLPAITALIAAIIERTSRGTDFTPFDLLTIIKLSLEDNSADNSMAS